MERTTIAPEEDCLVSDEDDKFDEEIMRMFGSNTGITLKVKGGESTQAEGGGKGGEGGDGEEEGESGGEGSGEESDGESDGEGQGEGQGEGKGGDESTPDSGVGEGGEAGEGDDEEEGEGETDGAMEEEEEATLEKDAVAVGGEQVVVAVGGEQLAGDNECQSEEESKEEASGALLAMSGTGNETPVESDDDFPDEEEAVTGKQGFTMVDTNESEGVGGIFMLSKVEPEHVSEKLSTIQTRAGGSCLDLEIQPGFREPFGTFTDSESEEETKKKKRIPTGKTIVKKRRPTTKPTSKKEDSDSDSVVELDEVERPPAKKKSAVVHTQDVVLQSKGGSTGKLHKEIQKKARRTGKLPKEKEDEEGVLPGVDERPKLTEEEEALVETVVRYTKKHLCNGKGSQSTFGGSLGRVLRRKHPVIYLHDIPLDKNFAKAFHSTFNKDYLDAIVARSSVQEKREGDKGNGRCVLNRIKSSSEADLHAFIRKELE